MSIKLIIKVIGIIHVILMLKRTFSVDLEHTAFPVVLIF